MFHRECAESTKLDAIAAREGVDDLIKDDIHDALDIAMVKMRISGGYFLYEL